VSKALIRSTNSSYVGVLSVFLACIVGGWIVSNNGHHWIRIPIVTQTVLPFHIFHKFCGTFIKNLCKFWEKSTKIKIPKTSEHTRCDLTDLKLMTYYDDCSRGGVLRVEASSLQRGEALLGQATIATAVIIVLSILKSSGRCCRRRNLVSATQWGVPV
jgi:hypothetical protein